MNVEGYAPSPQGENTRHVSKSRRGLLRAGTVAVLAVGGSGILGGCSDVLENHPEVSPSPSVSPSVAVSEMLPTESPSPTASLSPSPTESDSSSEIISKEVLALVPRMGVLTFSGGQSEGTPYASGIVISKNQFLTSAHLFGPKNPGKLCGDYQNTPFSYSVKTTEGDRRVVSLKRHPDPHVDLAILTIKGTFEADKNPKVKFAREKGDGEITVLNFQEKSDGATRSPLDGPAVFAGTLAPTTTTQTIDSSYYGPADWKTSLVTTPNEYGFNPQTGESDLSQDGSAKQIGSGGPLVSADGTIRGLQTAIPNQPPLDPAFLATNITSSDVDKLHSAASQPC